MEAQIQVNKAEIADTVAISQLRFEMEQSVAVSDEAKEMQAQQSLDIKKLKVAPANETVNAENERRSKQEECKKR